MIKKSFKAINFDLDTNMLKIYYNKPNISNAYKEIKNFLIKNNFIHRQGSGYISSKPISNTEITRLVIKLKNTFPWLSKSVKEFDVTNIEKTFSLKHILTEPINSKTLSKDLINKDTTEFQNKAVSLTNRLTMAKKQADNLNIKNTRKKGLEKENLL